MSEAFDWNRALNAESEPAPAVNFVDPANASAAEKPSKKSALDQEPAAPEKSAKKDAPEPEAAFEEPEKPVFEVVEGGVDAGLMILPDRHADDEEEEDSAEPGFNSDSIADVVEQLEAAAGISTPVVETSSEPASVFEPQPIFEPQPEPAPELDPVFTEGPKIDPVFAQPEPAPKVNFAPEPQLEPMPEPTFDEGTSNSDLLPPAPVHSMLPENLPDQESSMSKHYKPASLPDNIFDIPLSQNRFDVGSMIEHGDVEIIEDVTPVEDAHLDDILRSAIERKASDVHLTVGLPPMARIDGEVAGLPFSVLQAADTRRLVYDVLSDDSVQKFEQTHELDFGYGVSGLGRFRFNVYMQRGSVAGALRAIPTKIPSFEQLGLPGVIRDISKRTSGLVLVTGPTGSGKSTTIASMIDDINNTRTNHIMTIEDPIEYLHPHKKCMVNQRELHADTYSFHNALRAVLREDPDIILVGELRDLETIEAALTLAETGHLVFGTLHTRNAPSTIDRVVDVFPSDQQDQIRVLLGNTLEGVVSQQLLPRLGGGRSAAIEIMLGTPAVKNLIREGKTHQMYSVIETSANMGMQTMDSSLSVLFRQGYCSYDECLMRAVDKETFARLAKGG